MKYYSITFMNVVKIRFKKKPLCHRCLQIPKRGNLNFACLLFRCLMDCDGGMPPDLPPDLCLLTSAPFLPRPLAQTLKPEMSTQ